MKKYLKLLGLLLVLSLFIMGQAGCPGCGGFGKISGVVHGSIPNTLICKATVTATGGGRTYSTLTDETGRYELGVPAGTYTVTASKETFNNATSSVTVNTGETKTQDFNLTTGSGGTITGLPDISYSYLWAETCPSEIDIRSLKFNPSKGKKLEFNPNSLPIASRNSGDYRSYTLLQINIAPSDDTGIKGIRFYRSDNPNGPFILVDFSLLMSYGGIGIDTDVTSGTTRYYTFSFFGDSGESALQQLKSIEIPEPCILSSPSNEATVEPTPTFSWNTVPNADEYYIEVREKTDSGWNYIWGTSTTNTSITYGGNALESGKTYVWDVTAFKATTEETYTSGFASSSYPRKFSVSTSPQ